MELNLNFAYRNSVHYQVLNLQRLKHCLDAGRLPKEGVITMRELRDSGTIQRKIRDGVKILGRVSVGESGQRSIEEDFRKANTIDGEITCTQVHDFPLTTACGINLPLYLGLFIQSFQEDFLIS